MALYRLQEVSFEKNPKRFDVRAMYAIEKGDAEVAIIGASDASHHYISQEIEDSLQMSVFNYGKDGCFFIYQNCLINMMLQKHLPKVIIWEVGKDCLRRVKGNDAREWQSIHDFYHYYDKNGYCRKVIDSRSKLQRICMLSCLYRYNSMLLSIIKPFISEEGVTDTKGYVPLPDEGYTYPVFIESKGGNGEVDEVKETLLKETLALCKSKGVKVVFCYSPRFARDLSEQTRYYERLATIAVDNSVGMIDYRNYGEFLKDSTLFKDERHLNDKGAHLYMSYFIPDLKRILNIQ